MSEGGAFVGSQLWIGAMVPEEIDSLREGDLVDVYLTHPYVSNDLMARGQAHRIVRLVCKSGDKVCMNAEEDKYGRLTGFVMDPSPPVSNTSPDIAKYNVTYKNNHPWDWWKSN